MMTAFQEGYGTRSKSWMHHWSSHWLSVSFDLDGEKQQVPIHWTNLWSLGSHDHLLVWQTTICPSIFPGCVIPVFYITKQRHGSVHASCSYPTSFIQIRFLPPPPHPNHWSLTDPNPYSGQAGIYLKCNGNSGMSKNIHRMLNCIDSWRSLRLSFQTLCTDISWNLNYLTDRE